MSEYQIYQFKAIDRPLTPEERAEIGSWSSRTNPTSTSAVFTYAYGDFPREEEKVVEKYFDAMLHISSWGTKRLLFRLPKKLITPGDLSPYLINADHSYTTHLQLIHRYDCFLLDFYWVEEEGGGWIDEEDYRIGDFTPIREGILNGDYRALYLFWLKLAAFKAEWEEDAYHFDDELDNKEASPPPIPANLKKLNESLKTLAEFFEIDTDLVAAARQISPNTTEKKKDYEILIAQLTEKERMDFLMRLATGELNLGLKLRRHLEALQKPTAKSTAFTPSISELLTLSSQKEQERLDKEARQAAEAHRRKMEKMAGEKEMHWKSVFFNLDRKTGKSYDLATATLKDLQDLAQFQNQVPAFKNKMKVIRQNYGRSKVLLQRFEQNGLF